MTAPAGRRTSDDQRAAEQKRVALTAHPLQRVGAFALCALASVDAPNELTPDGFDAAVTVMTDDAIRAATVTDTKADNGFWLKTSGSFFPNSKMNHPSRLAKLAVVPDEVRAWRRMPDPANWPAAECALCGHPAVGFYGKLDVALAESISYRNTVPRGHGGLALCWGCLCSFYALPYGCALTGGASSVLHSFDDHFLRDQVRRQVDRNNQHITMGVPVQKGRLTREAAALTRLRDYEQRLRDGVDLMVFSNNNREQVLDVHSLAQPIAEWLRLTMLGSRRAGFAALLRSHRTKQAPGIAGLARNAFHEPAKIISVVAEHLTNATERDRAIPDDAIELANLCRDFAKKVLEMNNDDINQVEALAANLALVISAETVSGPLTGLLHDSKKSVPLQSRLQTMSAKWLVSPPPGASGPLITTRQFRLLFDPDGQSWLYRRLLAIAVLEQLSLLKWRPGDAKEAIETLDTEATAQIDIDDDITNGGNGELQ